TSGEKRVFLVILFTSFSGSLVSRIPGAVHCSFPLTSGDTSKPRSFNALFAHFLLWRIGAIKPEHDPLMFFL
ncbi:hypothetical protein, partial [Escherichia coli]|uniref:hypothetical protein n=1 Tax=Escherichia coli TaxID=562 RepID=UPI0040596419